jgi:hypothetical protein
MGSVVVLSRGVDCDSQIEISPSDLNLAVGASGRSELILVDEERSVL